MFSSRLLWSFYENFFLHTAKLSLSIAVVGSVVIRPSTAVFPVPWNCPRFASFPSGVCLAVCQLHFEYPRARLLAFEDLKPALRIDPSRPLTWLIDYFGTIFLPLDCSKRPLSWSWNYAQPLHQGNTGKSTLPLLRFTTLHQQYQAPVQGLLTAISTFSE